MEHEFVRLVRLLFNEQRHGTKTHNALELKRLLTLMIDLYRQEENTNVGNEKLNFE